MHHNFTGHIHSINKTNQQDSSQSLLPILFHSSSFKIVQKKSISFFVLVLAYFLTFHSFVALAQVNSSINDGVPIASLPQDWQRLPLPIKDLLSRSIQTQTLVSPDSRIARRLNLSVEEFVMRYVSQSQLRTLIEIYRSSATLGIWHHIERLRSIYVGSSWGIDFYGSSEGLLRTVFAQRFCEDAQVFVRPLHGDVHLNWYRQLPNPFRSGSDFHVGVDAGEGYNNIHFDSTNPVSTASYVNPFTEFTGSCVYSLPAVVYHNLQIRTGGIFTPYPQGFANIDNLWSIYTTVHRALTQVLDRERAQRRLRTGHGFANRQLIEQMTMLREQMFARSMELRYQLSNYLLINGPMDSRSVDNFSREMSAFQIQLEVLVRQSAQFILQHPRFVSAGLAGQVSEALAWLLRNPIAQWTWDHVAVLPRALHLMGLQ